MVASNSEVNWRQGAPEKGGIYYVSAIQYPAGTVYDVLFWQVDPSGDSYWVPFDSKIAKVVGFIPVSEVIGAFTGVLDPSDGSKVPDAIIQWQYGEPDRTNPCLAALRYMYDVMTWDEEFGWSVPLEHCDAYIPLDEFLTKVADLLPFEDKNQ
ncbi:hypothetical protein O5O45_27895 [Hahella aquimaris]|uniref:hypothetical protein n=1 Tax=Hahella sp. HNIBRBA332 TaxID=3015983 RepID=UPI00273CEE38|nr:hypothetical protein [Hahella sp. HNIBRBA332]WLQ13554.1 hypothetical protein O5O45_27895 [Hahella sp. HNIBRBA332]